MCRSLCFSCSSSRFTSFRYLDMASCFSATSCTSARTSTNGLLAFLCGWTVQKKERKVKIRKRFKWFVEFIHYKFRQKSTFKMQHLNTFFFLRPLGFWLFNEIFPSLLIGTHLLFLLLLQLGLKSLALFMEHPLFVGHTFIRITIPFGPCNRVYIRFHCSVCSLQHRAGLKPPSDCPRYSGSWHHHVRLPAVPAQPKIEWH